MQLCPSPAVLLRCRSGKRFEFGCMSEASKPRLAVTFKAQHAGNSSKKQAVAWHICIDMLFSATVTTRRQRLLLDRQGHATSAKSMSFCLNACRHTGVQRACAASKGRDRLRRLSASLMHERQQELPALT